MTSTPISTAQKRIFGTLFVTQAIYRATVIASFTLTPVIAAALSGSDAKVGFPNTVSLIGRAAFAYPVGLLMDRIGRRWGLSIGYAMGLIGGLISAGAIIAGYFWGFLLGALLLGMMQGSSEQGRYVAAEVYPATQRARIMGLIVFCGTIGAIGGPLLVDPAAQWSERFGMPAYAGPFLLVMIMMGITILLTLIFLHPDPLTISKQFNTDSQPQTAIQSKRSLSEIFSGPQIRLGLAAMVIGQLVMVLLMVVTPLHMNHHHHATKAISWVIMAHTLGMFGLSAFTGLLIDQIGRVKTIVIGVVILLISCVLAPVSTGVPLLALSLFLLGLGWNLCFVAGSTLLADSVEAVDRGRAQGAGEGMVAIVSGVGSFGVGSVFASGGIVTLAVICAVICLILLAFTRHSVRQTVVVTANP